MMWYNCCELQVGGELRIECLSLRARMRMFFCRKKTRVVEKKNEWMDDDEPEK